LLSFISSIWVVTPLRFRENYVQKSYGSTKETLSEAFKYVQEYHFSLLMTVYYRAADVAPAKQIRQTTEVTLIPREKLKERKEILERKATCRLHRKLPQ
jgi:hypothetical protein